MGSALSNCLDGRQVICVSQMQAEVLDLGMNRDAGLGKAADSTTLVADCTAAESEAQRKKEFT